MLNSTKNMFLLCVLVSSGCVAGDIPVLTDEDFFSSKLGEKIEPTGCRNFSYNNRTYTCNLVSRNDAGQLTHVQSQCDTKENSDDGITERCDHITYNTDDKGDLRNAVVLGDSLAAVFMRAALHPDHREYVHEMMPIGQQKSKEQLQQCKPLEFNHNGKDYAFKPQGHSQARNFNDFDNDNISFMPVPRFKEKGFFWSKVYTNDIAWVMFYRRKPEKSNFMKHYHAEVRHKKNPSKSQYTNEYHWKNIFGATAVVGGFAAAAWKYFGQKN